MIDTHCHLNADVFEGRIQSYLDEAKFAGVEMMFVVGWDERSSRKAVELAQCYPNLKAVIGVHPVDTSSINKKDLEWIKNLATQHPKEVIAIGEIGLDYYWQKGDQAQRHQKDLFVAQLELAYQLALPVVIHCRDAYQDILHLMREQPSLPKGIMHCYSGSPDDVIHFLNLGFDLSFGGPVTFKNAHDARESAKRTPLDRLHIETDSPYLTPHPFRGKENQSSKLPLVFEKICDIHGINNETLDKQLKENAFNLFHVKTK